MGIPPSTMQPLLKEGILRFAEGVWYSLARLRRGFINGRSFTRSGFIVKPLCSVLLAKGFDVRVVVRDKESAQSVPAGAKSIIVGDMTSEKRGNYHVFHILYVNIITKQA